MEKLVDKFTTIMQNAQHDKHFQEAWRTYVFMIEDIGFFFFCGGLMFIGIALFFCMRIKGLFK